jgi:AcrR family transcriptional regulator
MRRNRNIVSLVSVLELPAAASQAPTAAASVALSGQDRRIVEAALRCFARWGVGKTTLDDVAREAGYSRATVYRLFPGGKDALVDTVARTEVASFLDAIAARLDDVADEGLEEVLVVGMAEAGRRFSSHAALQYLLAHEPELVLPKLAFAQMDEVLRTAATFAGPWLARWLDDESAARVAEWAARILLSYASCPADGIDIGDEASIRSLVRTFVLPGTLPEGEHSA